MSKISRSSVIMLSAILSVALLIAAVCGFAYSPYSTEPVEAAEASVSSANVTGTSSSGGYKSNCKIYIYYDNTYVSSASIATSTLAAKPSGQTVYYNWSGQFTLTPKSGLAWGNGATITGKFAWSSCKTTESAALTDGKTKAQSGTAYTFTKGSGNTFSLSGSIPQSDDFAASSSSTNWGVGVLILNDFDAQQFNYNITASVTNGSADKAMVDKTSDLYIIPLNTQNTFIYTANSGYSISMVKINNAIVAISEVQPEEFAYAVGCEYKCFRNQNQVYVIVTGLWEDITIEASCDILFTTNTLTTDLQVVSSSATSSGSTLDARIILEYNWTPNVRFRLDGGAWNNLVGSNGGGIVGTSTYSFSRHEAKFYIIIEIYGLSQTTHSVEVDYYAGGGGGITPSVYNNSGSATFEQYVDDNITRVVVTPATNTYVTALYIDNVRFPVQYYRAEVFGAGMATAIQYIAHDTNNTFVVLAQDVYRTMAIQFELSSTLPNLEEPPTSSGTVLTGTVATATIGGEVRMTGFSGDENEDSTLHFVALAYSGYNFAGWRVDGEILEGYNAVADIPYNLVNGKIVTAVFEPKNTDSTTNGDLHDPTNGADIL